MIAGNTRSLKLMKVDGLVGCGAGLSFPRGVPEPRGCPSGRGRGCEMPGGGICQDELSPPPWPGAGGTRVWSPRPSPLSQWLSDWSLRRPLRNRCSPVRLPAPPGGGGGCICAGVEPGAAACPSRLPPPAPNPGGNAQPAGQPPRSGAFRCVQVRGFLRPSLAPALREEEARRAASPSSGQKLAG